MPKKPRKSAKKPVRKGKVPSFSTTMANARKAAGLDRAAAVCSVDLEVYARQHEFDSTFREDIPGLVFPNHPVLFLPELKAIKPKEESRKDNLVSFFNRFGAVVLMAAIFVAAAVLGLAIFG